MSARYLLLLLAVGGGIWYFFQNYRISGLDAVRVLPKSESAATVPAMRAGAAADGPAPAARPQGPSFKIASLVADRLDRQTLLDPAVSEALKRLVSEHPLVALHQIPDSTVGALAETVETWNATAANFDFVAGPVTGPGDNPRQSAIVYDRTRIELARTEIYALADPDGLLTFDPLVVGFRVRGPAENEAFTGTVVLLSIDAQRAHEELSTLPQVFKAVERDGREEDDVLVVGPLLVDGTEALARNHMPLVAAAVKSAGASHNLFYNTRDTVEFIGRAEELNLVVGLGLDERQIDRLTGFPAIAAEFRTTEGGDLRIMR